MNHSAPLGRPRRLWIALRNVAPASVLTLVVLHVIRFNWAAWHTLTPNYDGAVYLLAAGRVLDGLTPITSFGGVPYIYPPLLAVLLAPLALLPLGIATALWLATIALGLLLLILLLRHLVGWRIALAGTLLYVPVWTAIWSGQVGVHIAILMTLAVLALERRQPARAGACLAIGFLLKVTPALGLVVLVFRQSYRAALAALAITVCAICATLPVVGAAAWRDGLLFAATATQTWATGWVGALSISWTSLLMSELGWSSTALTWLVVVPALALTVLRARKTPEALALAAALIVPLLVSWVAWDHHTVHALPALAVLHGYSRRGRWLATGSWLAMTLFGGIAFPICLTLCWLGACWPALLGPMIDERTYNPSRAATTPQAAGYTTLPWASTSLGRSGAHVSRRQNRR